MKFICTAVALLLATGSLAVADTIHVVVREYDLERGGDKEPAWKLRGKPREWHEASTGYSERAKATIFPEVRGSFDFDDPLHFVAVRSLRGRMVIDLMTGEKLLAHAQDNLLREFCALSYTYSDVEGVIKIEIKAWTTAD